MNVFAVFNHLQKDKQRHSLCEARQKKTRQFQTQLLHYFCKSDNKSNHHHYEPLSGVLPLLLLYCPLALSGLLFSYSVALVLSCTFPVFLSCSPGMLVLISEEVRTPHPTAHGSISAKAPLPLRTQLRILK